MILFYTSEEYMICSILVFTCENQRLFAVSCHISSNATNRLRTLSTDCLNVVILEEIYKSHLDFLDSKETTLIDKR